MGLNLALFSLAWVGLTMEYKNFILRIDNRTSGAAEGAFNLRAESEVAGEAPDDWTCIDPRDAGLVDAVARLEEENHNKSFLKELGALLYQQLFRTGNGEVEKLLYTSLGAVSSTGLGLRIQLRIAAPELKVLPWELLYPSDSEGFLCGSTEIMIVRYLEVRKPVGVLRVEPPVRLLAVVPGGSGLDSGKERRQLELALLQTPSQVQVDWLEGSVDINAVRTALLGSNPYHIVHFIGHGYYDGEETKAFLYFDSDSEGEEQVAVGEDEFADVFRDLPSTKLVVLNACETGTTSPMREMTGLAPRLMQCGIPAVVAMQYAIYDDVAVDFSSAFYRSLLTGRDRGRIDVAVAEARHQLGTKYGSEYSFVAPVLFMRAKRGTLFEFSKGTPFKDSKHTIEENIKTRREDLKVLKGEPEEESHKKEEELAVLRLQKILTRRKLALLLALPCFAVMWTGILDGLFGLETRSEQLAMGFYDKFTNQPINPNLALVVFDDKTEMTLGKFGPENRIHHGNLINRLVDAGARVIAFDMAFYKPNTDQDSLLKTSVERAAEKGTAVLVAATKFKEGNDGIGVTPTIGVPKVCVNGFSGNTIVLALKSKELGELLPSLALQAVASFLSKDPTERLKFRTGGFVQRIDVLSVHPGREFSVPYAFSYRIKGNAPKRSLFTKGSRRYAMHMEYSDAKEFTQEPVIPSGDRGLRYKYEDLLQWNPSDLTRHFDGRLVLVGGEVKRDEHPVFRKGRNRYGVWLHLDAMNSVLNGRVIRSLDFLSGFGSIVVVCLFGGVLAIRAKYRYRTMFVVSLVLCVISLGVGAVLYSSWRLFLNPLHLVLAFFVSYMVFVKFKHLFVS